jgi:hypothetical protein
MDKSTTVFGILTVNIWDIHVFLITLYILVFDGH